MSKRLDPNQDQRYVGPDLGPDCVHGYHLTTNVAASRQRVNQKYHG